MVWAKYFLNTPWNNHKPKDQRQKVPWARFALSTQKHSPQTTLTSLSCLSWMSPHSPPEETNVAAVKPLEINVFLCSRSSHGLFTYPYPVWHVSQSIKKLTRNLQVLLKVFWKVWRWNGITEHMPPSSNMCMCSEWRLFFFLAKMAQIASLTFAVVPAQYDWID